MALLRRGHNAVYHKKYAHGCVVLCFVVVMQSFIMNSHGVFIHILQGCFAGTGAIVRLPQCQWSKPDGYGKISQCITTTKHSKAITVCIFLGIYCIYSDPLSNVTPSIVSSLNDALLSLTRITKVLVLCIVEPKRWGNFQNCRITHIEGILPNGPYLPCVSMAGRVLLAGYHQYLYYQW